MIGSSFAGLSQTSKDTLCFDLPTVRKLLTSAEQGKILKEQVTILNERIANQEIIIDNLKEKDAVTVAAYQKEIEQMKEQRATFEDQIKSYERLLKREKRKRVFTGIAGILTTAATFYIATKK